MDSALELNIPALVDGFLAQKRKRFPCHANRASMIGDICGRRLVYQRTRWEDEILPEIGLLRAFELGDEVEKRTLQRLQDIGLKIIRQQESFLQRGRNNETLITGHIDAILEIEGREVVIEIKSMHPAIWEHTNTVEDFLRHEWTQRYPVQLNLYCYGCETNHGLWILVNKSSDELKQIEWKLDFALAEKTLQRCETINEHVRAGTLPEQLQNHPDTCERCSFNHICLPVIDRIPAQFIVDEQLANDVEEMFHLEKAAERWEFLKENIKKRMNGVEKAVIGKWLYDGNRRNWKDRWKTSEPKTM